MQIHYKNIKQGSWRHYLIVAGIYSIFIFGILLPVLDSGYVFFLDSIFSESNFVTGGDTLYSLGIFDYFVYYLSFLIPSALIQRVYIFLVLLIIPIIGYYVSRLMFRGLVAFLVGFGILWNPFVYSRFVVGHFRVLLGGVLALFLIHLLSNVRINKKFLVLYIFLASILSIHFLWYALFITFIYGIYKVFVTSGHRRWFESFVPLFCVGVVSTFFYVVTILMNPNIRPSSLGDLNFRGSALGTIFLDGFYLSDTLVISMASLLGSFWNIVVWIPMFMVFVFGVYVIWGLKDRRFLKLLLAVGLGAFVLSFLSGDGMRYFYDFLVKLPGGIVMREGQKWLFLYVCLFFFSIGAALERFYMWSQITGRILSVILFIAIFISSYNFIGLAGGQPVVREYPRLWYEAAELLVKQDRKLLFLPWTSYDTYSFVNRKVANPAGVFFGEENVIYSSFYDNGKCNIYFDDNCLNYSDGWKIWHKFFDINNIGYILVAKTYNGNYDLIVSNFKRFKGVTILDSDSNEVLFEVDPSRT